MDSRDIHILAVDDSHLDRKVVERLLKNSSYKVTTVDSAFRALEVLGIQGTAPMVINAIKINLIITDYCMPEMTGYDLLKKVKESSALREIPVVIMSSENVAERITMCLAEGAKEFILKPLRLADVKRLRSHITSQEEENGEFVDEECAACTTKRKPFSNSVSTKRQATSLRCQKTADLISNTTTTTNNNNNNNINITNGGFVDADFNNEDDSQQAGGCHPAEAAAPEAPDSEEEIRTKASSTSADHVRMETTTTTTTTMTTQTCSETPPFAETVTTSSSSREITTGRGTTVTAETETRPTAGDRAAADDRDQSSYTTL